MIWYVLNFTFRCFNKTLNVLFHAYLWDNENFEMRMMFLRYAIVPGKYDTVWPYWPNCVLFVLYLQVFASNFNIKAAVRTTLGQGIDWLSWNWNGKEMG